MSKINRHQQVFIGESAVENFIVRMQEMKNKTIFLVRGKASYDISGAKNIIDDLVRSLNIRLIEFFDFSQNPKEEDMRKGLSLLSAGNADMIAGIGGGSVIDMAKLLRFFHSYDGDIAGTVFEKKKDLLPLYVLPTTAGTGSEVTHFAVLYKEKVKYSVAHEVILPDMAFIYPPFTYDTSEYLTASAGFDALAQAIEAYWSINATEESDKYAIKAIELLWENLPLAVNTRDENPKNRMSEGAYYAGKAINITKTTAPHAMSYTFTAHYGIPHGHAVALTFPFFMEYNTRMPEAEYNGKIPFSDFNKKMDFLFHLVKIDENQSIRQQMKSYITALGLNVNLPNLFDMNLILNNINSQRAKNNPRLLIAENIAPAVG